MAIVEGIKKMLSVEVSKKFALNCGYGWGQYGLGRYGTEPVKMTIGDESDVELSGIYQRRCGLDWKTTTRENFYIPKNPRSDEQNVQRQKMTDGVAAWQALTAEQKEAYNKSAMRKRMSGYNLFLKEYLLSA